MTIAPEAPVVDEDEDTTTEAEAKKRERDFTKFRPQHQELADYVNANSGLDPVSPNQVKALLALRIDFNNLPEQVAKRAERKEQREAEKSKFAGKSAEQIKALRAASRQAKQAEKLAARAAEAAQKAEALKNAAEGSGEDLAALVEAQQAETSESKRRIGRRR